MLSAPIINPITLLSTYAAYGWFKKMVLWRAGLGVGVAVFTGLLVYMLLKKKDVLKKTGRFELNIVRDEKLSFTVKLSHALTHAADDFYLHIFHAPRRRRSRCAFQGVLSARQSSCSFRKADGSASPSFQHWL